MANETLESIRKGWKVFAGADQVGEVMDVGTHDISVGGGAPLRHVYRVPEEYVAEASDGVVDLRIDRAGLESLEAGAAPQ